MNLLDKNAYIGVKYSDTTNPSTSPNSLYQLKDKFTNTTTGEIFTCYANESYGVSWAGTQGTILDANILATNNANLVAMFTGDNIIGSTLVDESGNGNNGTITGATQVSGKIGNSLNFVRGGTADYVDIGRTSFEYISNSLNFSITGWFYLDTSEVFHNLLGNSPAVTAEKGFGLFINAPQIRFDIVRGVAAAPTISYTTTGGSIPAISSGFEFFAITGDASDGLRVYQGSTLIGSSAWSNPAPSGSNTRNTHLGRSNSGSDINDLDGKLDQVRFFNRALTPNEIATLYAEGL